MERADNQDGLLPRGVLSALCCPEKLESFLREAFSDGRRTAFMGGVQASHNVGDGRGQILEHEGEQEEGVEQLPSNFRKESSSQPGFTNRSETSCVHCNIDITHLRRTCILNSILNSSTL